MSSIGALLAALLLAAIPARAAEVRVSIYEKQTGETTAFTFDLERGSLRRVEGAMGGKVLPPIETYRVVSGSLCSSACLAEADGILFQGRRDDVDIVVLRKEYNSFSTPLRWLAALSGHPVQVSSIRIVSVAAGRVRAEAELARKASSYDWEAKVVE